MSKKHRSSPEKFNIVGGGKHSVVTGKNKHVSFHRLANPLDGGKPVDEIVGLPSKCAEKRPTRVVYSEYTVGTENVPDSISESGGEKRTKHIRGKAVWLRLTLVPYRVDLSASVNKTLSDCDKNGIKSGNMNSDSIKRSAYAFLRACREWLGGFHESRQGREMNNGEIQAPNRYTEVRHTGAIMALDEHKLMSGKAEVWTSFDISLDIWPGMTAQDAERLFREHVLSQFPQWEAHDIVSVRVSNSPGSGGGTQSELAAKRMQISGVETRQVLKTIGYFAEQRGKSRATLYHELQLALGNIKAKFDPSLSSDDVNDGWKIMVKTYTDSIAEHTRLTALINAGRGALEFITDSLDAAHIMTEITSMVNRRDALKNKPNADVDRIISLWPTESVHMAKDVIPVRNASDGLPKIEADKRKENIGKGKAKQRTKNALRPIKRPFSAIPQYIPPTI